MSPRVEFWSRILRTLQSQDSLHFRTVCHPASRWQTLGTAVEPNPASRWKVAWWGPSLTGSRSGRAELGAAGLPLLRPSPLHSPAVASGRRRCQPPGPQFPTTRTCPAPQPGQMAPCGCCAGPRSRPGWRYLGLGSGRAPLIGLQPVPRGH